MLYCWQLCFFALCSAEPLKLGFVKQLDSSRRLQQRYVNLPITNEVTLQRYVVNFTAGTPPQPFSLTIDTGSSDTWLPASNSSGCAPNCPGGTFDPAKSSTYKQEPGVELNVSYGVTPYNPNTTVTGPYFNDTIRLGSAVIENFHFGLGNVPSTLYEQGTFGIFALGSRLGQSSYSNPSSPYRGQVDKLFSMVYDELQAHGYTKRKAFSLYLNSLSSRTGTLIFGGIDTAKYQNELVSVPVQLQQGSFFSWNIVLTSVSRLQGTKNTTLTAPDTNIAVDLDCGAPSMYLPTDLVTSIQADLNATMHEGTPYVPCVHQHNSDILELTLGGPDGARIQVPYSSLLDPYGAPAARGPVTINGTDYCYFGVIATPGPIYLLGDTFQRAAYIVYDVDNQRVAMAQAKENVKEEKIVEIPTGTGLGVPVVTNTYVFPTATTTAGVK